MTKVRDNFASTFQFCVTVCTLHKTHFRQWRMFCISDKSSLANHGGVSTFETQPFATWRMSQITGHICFSSVYLCSHFLKAHCKSKQMFYTICEVLFESDECSTKCERCSLKVTNVLQNVRGALWKWWMFCTWGTPRGRGSVCVSRGETDGKTDLFFP